MNKISEVDAKNFKMHAKTVRALGCYEPKFCSPRELSLQIITMVDRPFKSMVVIETSSYSTSCRQIVNRYTNFFNLLVKVGHD